MSSESGAGRRKRMTAPAADSIFNRLSGASQSVRNRGSSLLSKFQADIMGMQESNTIRCREWVLVFTEFLLAFSWNCFVARENSEKTMELRGRTPRQDTIESLFWLGWASIGNVVVGQLMDSFDGTYFIVLINVAMHFALASLFLIGEIVHETSSEDVYVYAMDQVTEKKGAFVLHYTFMYSFFGMVGQVLFAILEDTAPSSEFLAAIAFCFNGTVLFLFAYLLRPRPRIAVPPPRGAALKVWGVLFTALRNKRKFGKKIVRLDWLDFAENKYDKGQIARTRRLFRVFLMALPTAGFILFTTNVNVIFKEFYDNLKLSGILVPKYLRWIVLAASVAAVVCVEYGLIPLLRVCKYKVNFMKRFLLGYMSLVFAVTIAAIVTSATEKLPIRYEVGTLRVYNTMEGTISFDSMQGSFTQLHFFVSKKGTVSASFQTREQNLFRMAVTFTTQTLGDDIIGNTSSYTQLFSVAPQEVLQYVAIAPSTVLRVPGFLPIKQGPPGKNDRRKPRCFMVSLIGEQMLSVYIIDEKTEERITLNVDPGKVVMFQVEEGNYALQYTSSFNPQTTAKLETGGLYGIYLFLGFNEYKIDVDKILPENTNHAMIGLAVSIPMGIARGVGQVALDAFIYISAPDGLKGLSFGVYRWCAHTTAWFLLVGFNTWHRFITPNIIVWYAVIAVASFIVCLVLLIRFRNHYTM